MKKPRESTPNPNLQSLIRRSQANLIEFLRIEYELSKTLVSLTTTRREIRSSSAAAESLKNAQKGLDTMRLFERRITDKKARAEIHKLAGELEKLIADA